jgi:oligoribonuclease
MDKKTNLIWIDLEMTGLIPEKDFIIEIATVVTDKNLEIIAKGPNLAIYQDDDIIANMNKWNTKHHTQSGLIKRVQKSKISNRKAETETLSFLKQYVNYKTSPMCGNSICQDRRFLSNYMPELEDFFHYRHIDVSTLKELKKLWSNRTDDNFKKHSKHLALDDVYDSIDELKHYRENIMKI